MENKTNNRRKNDEELRLHIYRVQDGVAETERKGERDEHRDRAGD